MKATSRFSRLFPVLLLGVSISSCYVYSPPIRVANVSAPGKLKAGNAEVEIAVNQVLEELPPGLHAGGGYAVNDYIAIEAGVDSKVRNSSIGNAGLRFVPLPISKQRKRIKLLFDLVLGGGIGAGGMRDYTEEPDNNVFSEDQPIGENDGLDWNDRLAGGAYVGTGIGFNIRHFDLFGRFGWQVSKAYNIPTTQFFSFLFAPQFNIVDVVKLYGGPGIIGYRNAVDSSLWFYGEIGVGVSFGLKKDASAKNSASTEI